MTLPSEGTIAISDICTELGLDPSTNISLDDSRCRNLCKVTTPGSEIGMDDFHGKSNFEYKAYVQNVFANFSPPGQANPYAPVTWWLKGFRIESLDQSIILRRMVGYDASGNVLFDKTATGKAEYADNTTNYNNNAGWHVENTEWFSSTGFNSITNLQYSLSCASFYTKNSQATPLTVCRVVVYDANGNAYPIDRHRNFSVQAMLSGATYPFNPVALSTVEIVENN